MGTDLSLTVTEIGAGRPVLVLHGGGGPDSVGGIVDHFAADSHVLAPTHPGWAGTPRPDWFSGVDELAITYLDLLDDLRDVLVVGSSFGGWVAAELAVRDRGHRIGGLVLIDAIGPLIPGHEVVLPGGRGPEPGAIATMLAYTGESLGDPRLLRRLARVSAPVLVLWGEQDTVVTPEFGRAYASAFPHSRFQLVAGAGHLPAVQSPEATFAAIDAFRAG